MILCLLKPEWMRSCQLPMHIEDQMGALSRKVDRTVEALANNVSKLESRLGSGSGASSTTSAGSPTWADRPKSSNTDRISGWVPRTLFVRGWAPFGCPTSQKISKEEALLSDNKVRAVSGAVCDDLVSLPGYVCNHQIAYRLKEGCPRSLYDIKADLAARLEAGGVLVRGLPLRVVAEQSPQRKLEYGQYARALDETRAEPDLARKWVEDGRTLRVYASPSWQATVRRLPVGSGICRPSLMRTCRCRRSWEGSARRMEQGPPRTCDSALDSEKREEFEYPMQKSSGDFVEQRMFDEWGIEYARTRTRRGSCGSGSSRSSALWQGRPNMVSGRRSWR